jgi:glycogen debranching enzyme
LSKIDKKTAENILFSYLDRIDGGGRLPDIVNKENKLGSADAHGWLFFRIRDFVQRIHGHKRTINSIKDSLKSADEYKNKNPNIKNYLKKYSLIISKKEDVYHKNLFEVESCLEKSIMGLLKQHTKDAFETNSAKETWMDTDFNGDNREGIRIEMQALRLNMYKLMFELTQNQKYRILENLLKSKIRQHFWNGKILADGLNDFTIRPNVFIAAYAYHELLSEGEWEECFENALKALWLDWGGLSTIDKNNLLFCEFNTGEDSRSYHRGDSWFWINNLAALMLNSVNKDKFKSQIKKIIDASTEEILWKGCIGCHSEISSAKELTSKGCFSQAWSNAMYAEMVDEVFG